MVVPETFDQVLQSTLHAHHFRAFLYSRKAAAPLLLLEAIDCYRAMDNEEWRVTAAQAIVNTFLKADAPEKVSSSVSESALRRVMRMKEGECDYTFFDAVYGDVFNMLSDQFFGDYAKSMQLYLLSEGK